MNAEPQLPAEIRDTLDALSSKLASGGLDWLEVYFASLPRRLGREALEGDGSSLVGDSLVDWRSFRRCDLGALRLLREAALSEDQLFALWNAGDFEERRMILKSLHLLPTSAVTIRLLQEAHRQNDQQLFEAAFADGDLPARVLSDEDYNRFVLKAAFTDLPLARLFGAASRANVQLSSMLLEFMSEREAAGRPVWAGSLELAAHAPAPGVVDRIRGDMWQGQDECRSVASRAAVVLASGPARDEILTSLKLRVERERKPALRELLQSAL